MRKIEKQLKKKYMAKKFLAPLPELEFGLCSRYQNMVSDVRYHTLNFWPDQPGKN